MLFLKYLKYISAVFLLIGIFSFVNTATAQNFSNDLQLVSSKKTDTAKYKRHVKFLFIPDKKIIKYNPVSLAFGGLMYIYQSVISSQIAADCPYEVSCSSFSKQCITKYGVFKGFALSADRLTRCTKFAAKDLHPLKFNAKGKIIDSPEEYKLRNEK